MDVVGSSQNRPQRPIRQSAALYPSIETCLSPCQESSAGRRGAYTDVLRWRVGDMGPKWSTGPRSRFAPWPAEREGYSCFPIRCVAAACQSKMSFRRWYCTFCASSAQLIGRHARNVAAPRASVWLQRLPRAVDSWSRCSSLCRSRMARDPTARFPCAAALWTSS